MRVLVIGVNYAPEITGIAPYTSTMAEGLHEAGHDVQVIAGIPHYPQWANYTGFRGLARTDHIEGVRVRRVRHFVGSGGTGLGRILQEITFGLNAVLQSWKGADVVVAVSPPLLSAGLALIKARLTGRGFGIWIQDLYSNGAREISGRHLQASILGSVESRILRAADGVLVIHDRFKRHVVSDLGVAADYVDVSRNWSHLDPTLSSDAAAMRERHFPGARFVAIHTGNMGAKQHLENVVEAARLADRTHSEVVFGLVGNGSRRAALIDAAKDVDNLVFVPSLDDEDYLGILRCADVLIVNEKPGLREAVLPSKLTSYFNQGKPVIAATERDSATADEVTRAGAGQVIQPGNPGALLRAVEDMACDEQRAAECGESARSFAAANLTEESAIGRVSSWLDKLAARTRRGGAHSALGK